MAVKVGIISPPQGKLRMFLHQSGIDKLTGYEKGLVARYLLQTLIKQGFLDRVNDTKYRYRIVMPIADWQLELLASFSEGKMDGTQKGKIDENSYDS